MLIRSFLLQDLPEVLHLYNQASLDGEVLLKPLDEDTFRRIFLSRPDMPDAMPVAVDETTGRVLGFAHYVTPLSFPDAPEGRAFLTTVMVDRQHRHTGVASRLLDAVCSALNARSLSVSSLNPVNLTWHIPGTPGHDHNNMPGLDRDCKAYGFFLKKGFQAVHSEMAMYMDLKTFAPDPGLEKLRDSLRLDGIETGIFAPPPAFPEFDGMCTRVGSPYWRAVLRTETKAWRDMAPNEDPRFWPDGRKPAGPRPLILALKDNQVVGFTGPVDLQESGRGWFTGICTDPLYQHRGIATVLFSLLMQAFREEGAAFTTLFTGTDNRAQRIYKAAGLRPVRTFDQMVLDLSK